ALRQFLRNQARAQIPVTLDEINCLEVLFLRDTVFLVGNGLTIDYLDNKNFNFDSSNPFSLKVPCKEPNLESIIEELPNLKKYIERSRNLGIKNDFNICEKLKDELNNSPFDKNLQWIHGEMRQYFSLAYSLMQIIYDYNLNDWNYIKHLKKVKSDILGLISFNYDLLLERILMVNGINFYRYGVANESGYIPVFKPHGSIDFEAGPGTISIEPPINRFKNQTFLNEIHPMISLAPRNYLVSRVTSDIVLPSEPSPQTKLSWVKRTYDWIKLVSSDIKHFVIIGISYWECDRPEINNLLKSLPLNCKVHIINPNPPKEMINKLKKLGLEYSCNEYFS
ncbi:MAG: hypothetical protein ACOCUD_04440, partial [Bacillota bacterium]